jgi:hypothetical protein
MADALQRHLHVLIASEKRGGRTIRTDENTVVLYDCCQWSDAHSRALASKFPCAEVSILPSQSSLSGFIVVVRSSRDPVVWAWILGVLALLGALVASLRHIVIHS